jgi:hypothetical protein
VDLLGNTATVTEQPPNVIYTSERWPFGASIWVYPDGGVVGRLSSGGTALYLSGPSVIAPEAMALELDAAAKVIFGQCSWYQQP